MLLMIRVDEPQQIEVLGVELHRKPGLRANRRTKTGVQPRSPSRPAQESELEQITQLAVTLSGRVTRNQPDDMHPAIAEVLEQIAMAVHMDRCQLIEFTASGAVARAHVPSTRCTPVRRRS